MKAVWLAACVVIAAAWGWIVWNGYTHQTLDYAQAGFEAAPANIGWNWAGWRDPAWDHHGGHGLKCVDGEHKTLRICRVEIPVTSGDGVDHGMRNEASFLCTRDDCVWLAAP